MAVRDPERLLPAPFADRVIARCIDLWRIGVVLILALLPAACGEFVGQNLVMGGSLSRSQFEFGDIDFGELAGLLIFGIVVALSYEPLRLARKGATSGKANRRMELRRFDQPGEPPSSKRAIGRYLVSVGTCVAAAAGAIGVSAAVGVVLTLWTTVGLVAASSSVAWLSVLLSARLRADRRGWHDVLVGTMLVTTRRYRPAPAPKATE